MTNNANAAHVPAPKANELSCPAAGGAGRSMSLSLRLATAVSSPPYPAAASTLVSSPRSLVYARSSSVSSSAGKSPRLHGSSRSRSRTSASSESFPSPLGVDETRTSLAAFTAVSPSAPPSAPPSAESVALVSDMTLSSSDVSSLNVSSTIRSSVPTAIASTCAAFADFFRYFLAILRRPV